MTLLWQWRLRRVCRTCLAAAQTSRFSSSPRSFLGDKYIAKLDKAEEAWQERAKRISNGEETNLFDEFQARGFVKDIGGTEAGLRELMRVKRVGAYVGIDPTAPSLHIGHLLPLMPIFWMYMHGYRAVTLLGGATAKIGDPSGRTKDRQLMTSSVQAKHTLCIHYQLKRLWTNVEAQARRYGFQREWAWKRGLVNNNAWWNKQSMVEVMQVLGSRVRVGPLLAKDIVKTKLEGDGLSFSELSYTLMQGWDWWELYKQQGVQMQIGGSDQYGNIVTGMDAVKFVREGMSHECNQLPTGFLHDPVGFTVPLLTNSAGVKIGKSSGGGNLWLDKTETSAYDLYGYFVRQPDEDVGRLLKLLTFIPLPEIEALVKEHESDKPKRVAQHRLALEVLRLVHGNETAEATQQEHRLMVGGGSVPVKFEHSPDNQLLLNSAPSLRMQLPKSLIYGKSIARILYAAGLATSVSDGQRLALQKAVYIGAQGGGTQELRPGAVDWAPVAAWYVEQTQKYVIGDNLLLLRKGKHHVRCIEIVEDDEYAASGMTYPGMPNIGKVRLAKERLRLGKDGKGLPINVGNGPLDNLKEELSQAHDRDAEPAGQTIEENWGRGDLDGPRAQEVPPSDSKLINLRKSLEFMEQNFDPAKHHRNSHPAVLRKRIAALEQQQSYFQTD